MGIIFLYFVDLGLRAGMEGFHPIHVLQAATRGHVRRLNP